MTKHGPTDREKAIIEQVYEYITEAAEWETVVDFAKTLNGEERNLATWAMFGFAKDFQAEFSALQDALKRSLAGEQIEIELDGLQVGIVFRGATATVPGTKAIN